MNNSKKDDLDTKIALFRYELIIPVLNRTYPDRSALQYFKRIASAPLKYPDGTSKEYSFQTIRYWYDTYQKEGFSGLMPKTRNDKGRSRKLNKTLKNKIIEMKQTNPRMTATSIYLKLIEDGNILKKDISLSTITRFIASKPEFNHIPVEDMRAFEMEHTNDMWQLDTTYCSYIKDSRGHKLRTYLIMIIDDHSRMIVGYGFFLEDNAVNVQKVWHDAVLRYGRSQVIILDNGSSYKNKSTREIEARLGTRIIYNPPYSPTGKALIERFFHTMKMRFMDIHKGSDYHSLGQLNDDLNKWISEYNRTLHSSLKEDENDNHTPLERYMYDMKDVEVSKLSNKSPVDYASWLDDVFLHETTRKVNGDSTILIDNVLFDVPSIYIGMRVIIRYNPRTFGTMSRFRTT